VGNIIDLYERAAGEGGDLDDNVLTQLARRVIRCGDTHPLRHIAQFRVELHGELRDLLRTAAHTNTDLRADLLSRADATIADIDAVGHIDTEELNVIARTVHAELGGHLAKTDESGQLAWSLASNPRLDVDTIVDLLDAGGNTVRLAWAGSAHTDTQRASVLSAVTDAHSTIATLNSRSKKRSSRAQLGDTDDWCGPETVRFDDNDWGGAHRHAPRRRPARPGGTTSNRRSGEQQPQHQHVTRSSMAATRRPGRWRRAGRAHRSGNSRRRGHTGLRRT
jgi:hypothetical protein